MVSEGTLHRALVNFCAEQVPTAVRSTIGRPKKARVATGHTERFRLDLLHSIVSFAAMVQEAPLKIYA
jgi:hypothetical protein